MKDAVFETRELEVTYGCGTDEIKAIGSLSIRLEKGDSLAVVGESGCGKTTLVRTLLGIQRPTSGDILLFGKKLSSLKKGEMITARRKCGFIPQDVYGGLPPGLTATETVREPWDLTHDRSDREIGKKKAILLMARLGLNQEGLETRKVGKGLSGGQRQRIAVARALINDPQLLLADEPTSMQDLSTRETVIDLLNEKVDEGMSLVFVTHDLLLARSVARRTAVFFGGQLCEIGKSDEMTEIQLHPYTKALYDAMPRLNKKMILRASRDRTPASTGCPFRIGCPEAMYVCGKNPPLKEVWKGRMVACWKTTS